MRIVVLSLVICLSALHYAPAIDKSVIDRAVDRGIVGLKKLQQAGGTWPYPEIGATALAGLALLECDVPKTDPSIVAAAKAIRTAALSETKTYSLSLSLLFLDKLDDPSDTPLIESLVLRLLGGQKANGGWSYRCPSLTSEEIKYISAEMGDNRTLVGGRDLAKLPAKGKRSREDLAKPMQDRLDLLAKGVVVGAVDEGGLTVTDNSNTQFAALGLWVGRRYGIPTQPALLLCAQRFRSTQNADGGWSYAPNLQGGLMAATSSSSATMTCAGVFVLAAGQGAVHDVKRAKNNKTEKQDVSKDVNLRAGLAAISSVVGVPVGWNGTGNRHPAIAGASGKAFYFLWSLERAAVALNLERIDKKDWYNWGAEILVANQQLDGTWMGEYGRYGADTAFALMFLKRANLTRDLSGALTVPGTEARTLKGAGKMLTPRDLAAVGLGNKSNDTKTEAEMRAEIALARPKATSPQDKEVVQLGEDLVRAGPSERAVILKRLRDSKGVLYTETLVWSILRLNGEGQRQARVALAERFTRLKDSTLREYLKDPQAEIRRAAALAIAVRKSKSLVPDLIACLDDKEDLVRRAAHVALQDLTKQRFAADATAQWQQWWTKNSRE